MAPPSYPKSGYANRIPTTLVALGVALFLAQVGTHIVFSGLASLALPQTVLSVVLTGIFAVVVAGGGYLLRRSEVAVDRYPRLAAWSVGVGVAILAVNVVMIATWPAGTTVQNAAWAVQAAAMGLAGGTVIGSIEARAIERTRLAERARVEAENAETQQEWLEYLNNLLRHEVLNTANVVVGYSELLLEDYEGDEEAREKIERIRRRSRELTGVIQDVRLLIEAAKDQDAFEPVDVVDVIRTEASTIRDKHRGVTVETSLPGRALVPADDLLARVFSNLLSNAVEHSDAERPEVTVTVAADPDTVTVSIADNGPGVPEHERASLFERSGRGDHGIGLFLVGTLVDRYDGSVELAETGPDGSVFTVELPRVSPESVGVSEVSAVTADAT